LIKIIKFSISVIKNINDVFKGRKTILF